MRLIFTDHAPEAMQARGLTAVEVEQVVAGADVVEAYPDDRPYPSRLVLGWSGGRPIHVVTADVPNELRRS